MVAQKILFLENLGLFRFKHVMQVFTLGTSLQLAFVK